MYKQEWKGYIKILGGEGMDIYIIQGEKLIYSEGRVILINREEMVN